MFCATWDVISNIATSQNFPFVSFLPSVPLLFPLLVAKRLPQLQGTWGNAVKTLKTPYRIQGRVPADNTFWLGEFDQILSQLQGLRTPSRKQFLDILYVISCNSTCGLVHFGSWLTMTEKNMTGRRRHVAWPDFKFLEQKFCRMQLSERSEQENFWGNKRKKTTLCKYWAQKWGEHLHMRPLGQNLEDASPTSLL